MRVRGGGGEEDLTGEAERVAQCITVLNQCESFSGVLIC